MKIRSGSLVLCLVAACVACLPAWAEYPERPVRFIVPGNAGGSPDVNVRIIVEEVGRQMGQNFVVDNRPGAVGTIGTLIIANAVPDGYTIGTGNVATLAVNRSTLAKLPYDPDKVSPVVQWTYVPHLLAVTPSLPVRSVGDLIDLARKSPGKLLFASTPGGANHIGIELFKLMTATDMAHVPFKDGGFAITDLSAGRVHLLMGNTPALGPHVRSGRVRGVAVTTSKRVPAFSELPTVAESGVPGFVVTAWGGMVVPRGTPKPIVARLNAEVNRALAQPHVSDKLMSLGSEIVGGTPEQFREHIQREIARWADVVKRAGVKIH